MTGRRGRTGEVDADAGVYVISVAAQLSGLHPQTLRTYERAGLLTPARTVGGGRRYSARDLVTLAEIAELTSAGVSVAGVQQILALRDRVTDLEQDNRRLTAQRDAARDAASRTASQQPRPRLPALRNTTTALVVWRRNAR